MLAITLCYAIFFGLCGVGIFSLSLVVCFFMYLAVQLSNSVILKVVTALFSLVT